MHYYCIRVSEKTSYRQFVNRGKASHANTFLNDRPGWQPKNALAGSSHKRTLATF